MTAFVFPARHLRVLRSPTEFFHTLCDGVKSAKERVSLSSLYTGTGDLNRQLSSLLDEKKTAGVEVSVLLDAQRATRFSGSRSSLTEFSDSLLSSVKLFQTPLSVVGRYFPPRANEIFGTQHMKIYLYDDTVIISGANLSTDYFTNRQDRYWVFENCREIADYYYDLVNVVKDVSFDLDIKENEPTPKTYEQFRAAMKPPSGCPSPVRESNKFCEYAGSKLHDFLAHKKQTQTSLPRLSDENAQIQPTLQMGKFNVRNDQQCLFETISALDSNAHATVATAYFNVDEHLYQALINSRAHWNVLTASPQANGFLGSSGPSGFIPYFYLHAEYQFLQAMQKKNSQCQLYEWKKEGQSFHGKGLWISKDNESDPYFSICGSSNFGKRSLELDLETQVYLTTSNPSLMSDLREERDALLADSTPIHLKDFHQSSEHHGQIPKWIPWAYPVLGQFL